MMKNYRMQKRHHGTSLVDMTTPPVAEKYRGSETRNGSVLRPREMDPVPFVPKAQPNYHPVPDTRRSKTNVQNGHEEGYEKRHTATHVGK